MTAPTPIKKPAQPTLPGLESFAVTKRLIGTSGSFELSPEFDVDAAFMAYLESQFGQEVSAILTWANEDGEMMRASLTFTVHGSANVFHEDAEGEAGRIAKITLKASDLGLGEA